MSTTCALPIFVAGFLGIAMPSAAAVIYVDDSAAAGLNDGTSWENAFLDLQAALAMAQSKDKIHIGAGTYKPSSTGDRSATFTLPKRVVVRGGFAGVDSSDPNAWDPSAYPTILSGDLNEDDTHDGDNYQENSFHVVTADGVDRRAKLRGVTVTRGYARQYMEPGNSAGGAWSCSMAPRQRFRNAGSHIASA